MSSELSIDDVVRFFARNQINEAMNAMVSLGLAKRRGNNIRATPEGQAALQAAIHKMSGGFVQ